MNTFLNIAGMIVIPVLYVGLGYLAFRKTDEKKLGAYLFFQWVNKN